MDGLIKRKTTTTTTTTKEEVILFEYKGDQCDVIFVFGEETDTDLNVSLHCPSFLLNRISKEFQNCMTKIDDGSHYEIKAVGYSVKALTKALSFYQPKYFEYFKDSDDFQGILTVCSKFGLIELSEKIRSYFMTEHTLITNATTMHKQLFPYLQMSKDFGLETLYDHLMGLEIQSPFTQQIANSTAENGVFDGVTDNVKYEIIEKCIRTQIATGIIQKHHFPLLKMAKELGNDAFYDEVMRLKVGFSFTEDVAKNEAFAGMSDRLRYEIMKKCIEKDLSDWSVNSTNAVTLEVNSIFHFLDLYFYEKRIIDYALHPKISATISNTKYDSSILFQKNETNNVHVKVEGQDLFINSKVLSDNSPVFKAMLNSTFKEGLENVIELPGKHTEDIILLFSSLLHGKKITEYNSFKLLPLCREYQIDWLQDLIQEKLLNQKIQSDQSCLKHLNLSHSVAFQKGVERYVNALTESFIQLQRYKEFSDLADEIKLLVALRRLWYIYIYSCVKEKHPFSDDDERFDFLEYRPYRQFSNLFDKNLGSLSIFKDVVKVSFHMNFKENEIMDSFSTSKRCGCCFKCNKYDDTVLSPF